MSRLNIKQILFLASASALILSFQNCSPVDFQQQAVSGASTVNAMSNDGAVVTPGDPESGEEDQVNNDDSTSQGNSGVDLSYTIQPCDTGLPSALLIDENAQGPDMVFVDHNGPIEVSQAQSLKVSGNNGPVRATSIGHTSELAHLKGASILQSRIVDVIEDLSGPLHLSALNIGSVKDMKGPLTIKAQKVGPLENTGSICVEADRVERVVSSSGNVLIVGPAGAASRAEIERVTDSNAHLQISDMNVKLIQHHRGPITIINGNVGKLEDVSGPIRIINGSIGEAVDVYSDIVIKGGVIGSSQRTQKIKIIK